MIDKLIRYQELDIKLEKLKKEMIDFDNKSKKEQLIKYRKDKQAELIELDKTAIATTENLNKVLDTSAKGINLAEKYENSDLDNMSIEDLEDLLAKCKKTVSGFDSINVKLKQAGANSEKVLEDFNNAKKEIIKSGKLINEMNQNLDKIKEDKEPEIQKITNEMKNIEKDISADSLKKYKELKAGKIFPVIIKLNDRSCSYCGMQLSEGNFEVLRKNAYYQCENCRRIIVNK